MKTNSGRLLVALVLGALIVGTRSAFALGADYPNDQPVTGLTNWPKGLAQLVNATNRVHGFFVNSEDVFFFRGDASRLSAFLKDCSALEGVVSRRLVLQAGVGEAKSPWQKAGQPCDWKLSACPKGWRNLAVLSRQGTNSVEALLQAAREPGYVLEVHFWTGGPIALDQVEVPKNFEVSKE